MQETQVDKDFFFFFFCGGLRWKQVSNLQIAKFHKQQQ